MKNLKIIFIGGFFPDELKEVILSKSKNVVQNAANNFQWAFIKGLEQNLSHSIKLITAPFLGWYPKYYKDLVIRKYEFSQNGESGIGISVGFLNLPLIKNIFKYFNLKSSINGFLVEKEKTVLIVYSIDLANLKAALAIKQKKPAVLVCVIITDLHDFPGDAGFFYKLYLKYIEKQRINKLLSQADCFVVLVEKMVDFLKLRSKPFVTIEGIYNEQGAYKRREIGNTQPEKIILYTGTIEYRYCIEELLDAFRLIKSPQYRLWICGGGGAASLVMSRAQKDDRIIYYGIVGKDRIGQLQEQATILVNPRNTFGEYNKYSFPSKTIEYLASGTPTLLYRLDGIPSEYFDYCYIVEKNTTESLADAIFKTCELDPLVLQLMGEKARDFILKNKTAKMQCGKVLNMLNLVKAIHN